MDYVIGVLKPGPYACRLSALQNVRDDFELLRGISRESDWPEDAYFPMDKSFRQEKQLEDFIKNTNSVLVVSANVKSILSDVAIEYTEWLPVYIKNHKGRLVKEQYFVLHQTCLQDCIDLEKSTFERNPINPSIFMFVTKLVINEFKVEKELALFRIVNYPAISLFHRQLAERIKAAGCSGISFSDVEEWKG